MGPAVTEFTAAAADLVLGLHFLYVLFVVLGQAAVLIGAVSGWHWIRNRIFRLLHLLAIGIVAVQAVLGLPCPLTVIEHRFRMMAGQRPEQIAFIPRLFRRLIFFDLPGTTFLWIYLGFGALVALTFILVPPRRKSSNREKTAFPRNNS